MKPEDLLHSLEGLDEDILLDAKNHTGKRTFSPRRLAALVTAAVLASTLIGTCFASVDGAGWFRWFFAAQSGETLTNGKNAYLGQSTAAFEQSFTKDGYTISLESALSDGVNTILQFRVEVPEGTVLDAHDYSISNWQGFELMGANGETLRDSGGWDSLDEDPEDSSFSLLYTTDNHWYEPHIDKIFDTTWTVRIEGITARYMENLYTDDFRYWDESLVTGPWAFEVTIPESGNRELEFLTESVTCPGEVNIGIRGWHYEDLEITSLRLRALSAGITFHHHEKGEINARFDDFYVVMKDGSRISIGTSNSLFPRTIGYGAPGFTSFNFDAPIVLEEVDHILLPNGTKLYNPMTP